MILSVVVVSYNVKFFLEQCLSSLKKALEGMSLNANQSEVFIIDNDSSDGTVDFLKPLFPSFHFIRNKENLGFGKANNQGLTICTGEFILFLNPDTILAEDSIDKCISFFRATTDAGALGVHMVDGAGRFLRESKRGFPGPLASFYKMSGLASLFPRSKLLAAYYRGDLPEGSTHAVDILSGAFMMVRKSVLDKTGGFDEKFFMYAEDIDLSYRIIKAGFRNYYLADTSIIHFKGESTHRDSHYIRMFYKAMKLFMQKHFRGSNSWVQFLILNLGMRVHQTGTFLLLPFKKTSSGIKNRPTFFIKGEPAAQNQWKKKLAELDFTVSITETIGKEEIIFCEGPQLSWKSIIAEITNNRERLIYYFHGAGTHAAVASYSGHRRGEVLAL